MQFNDGLRDLACPQEFEWLFESGGIVVVT